MTVVLFDLEGTLVQTVEYDQEAILDFRTKTRAKSIALGIPICKLEDLTTSTLARNRALEYVEEHFDEKEALRFHLEMDKLLKKCELEWAARSKIFPEILVVLNKLEERGYKMGLVTNTSREAANHMLTIHNIKAFFPVVITREDVRRFHLSLSKTC